MLLSNLGIGHAPRAAVLLLVRRRAGWAIYLAQNGCRATGVAGAAHRTGRGALPASWQGMLPEADVVQRRRLVARKLLESEGLQGRADALVTLTGHGRSLNIDHFACTAAAAGVIAACIVTKASRYGIQRHRLTVMGARSGGLPQGAVQRITMVRYVRAMQNQVGSVLYVALALPDGRGGGAGVPRGRRSALTAACPCEICTCGAGRADCVHHPARPDDHPRRRSPL